MFPHTTDAYVQGEIESKTDRINELEKELEGLKETYRNVAQRDYSTAAKFDGMKQALRKWTLNELAQNELTTSQADELANIGDFELELVYTVTATVSYDFTVTLPAGESIDDVINNIDFDNVQSYDAEIDNISSSIDSIDYELED